MKKSKILMMFALAALMFSGCKKDEEDTTPNPDPTPTKTKTEMLTTGSWISTDLLVNGASWWSLVEPCEKDNFYTFKVGGTGVYDEGATKCDSGDPQTVAATWSLSSDGKKITIDDEEATLIELTETSLRMSSYDSTFNMTAEVRYKKK